ncbi:YadA-like family protein [Psychrobacter sp. AH5]|uniref:YadA family autotransporter adhesin n=1 Tax=Psychrobacter sp. AH5 TaxID=2937433 RepID=UPI003342BA27
MKTNYEVISKENTATTGTRLLRLSTLCAGLAMASFSMQAVAIVATIPGANPITVDTDGGATGGTITGLTNTTFDPNATYTGGQAATQEQVTIAANASRTEVVAGTNVSVNNNPGLNGQNVYTIDADGTTASAGSGDVTVVGNLNTTTNVTDFVIDLSPAIKTTISNNTAGVATNASGVAANVTSIGTNASGIATNASGIAANVTSIGTNASGIATNASGIAANVTSIGTNTTGIATNASGIAANMTSIGTNTTGIATNASGIAANVTSIGTNTTGIATNVTNIATNTTNIAKGLDFGGDSGADVNRQLGDKLTITGGETNSANLAAGNNVGVVANGTNNLTIRLAKDINLGANGSVKTGNTTINNNGFVNGSTTVNGSGVSIAGGPSMTTGGINAGNQVITGVANGTAPNHAANFGQLSALGYKVNQVEDDANAGISGALAMASLPQPYTPGMSMVSGAMGTYNDEGALAIGISAITDSGRWVIKAGATVDTQSNFGGSVGAGYQF